MDSQSPEGLVYCVTRPSTSITENGDVAEGQHDHRWSLMRWIKLASALGILCSCLAYPGEGIATKSLLPDSGTFCRPSPVEFRWTYRCAMSPARSVFVVPCRVRRAAERAGVADRGVSQRDSRGYRGNTIMARASGCTGEFGRRADRQRGRTCSSTYQSGRPGGHDGRILDSEPRRRLVSDSRLER